MKISALIIPLCLSLANPVTAGNLFTFSSSPGAWVGGGQTLTFTNVSASRTFNQGVYTDSVHFTSGGHEVVIVGPNLTLAAVGYYPGATRWPFMGGGAGLSFTSPGRGDNTLTGWFNVLQADYQADGQVAAFAVDFVQYDEGLLTKSNRGSIRFNSSIPVPGAAPPLQLSKLVRSNGVVQFMLTGPADTQCVLQTSSNLLTWGPLATNTISPVGQLGLSDSSAPGQFGRFYRAMAVSGAPVNNSNDLFANRFQIPSAGGTVTGSNVNATKEAGEPYHWGTTGGRSVWWQWQAPVSGVVTISTAGSSFDTILAAYTGSSVAGLSLVANNDDYGSGVTSQISFNAVAGTVYQIAVDGYGSASGTISLTLHQ